MVTAAFVVGALSTDHKIGLAAVAAVFIVFALLSSFVLPRRNPNFPGSGMGLYLLATVALFAAMLAAVLVFGREEKKGEAEAAPQEQTPTAATTEAGATTTSAGGTGGAPAPYAHGDAAAGKKVFTSAGCSSCHTLKAAGSHGAVGPNLDDAKPDATLIVERVTKGKGAMPSFKGQLSDKQIADVVAFVYSSTH